MNETDIAKAFATKLEASLFETMMGGPQRPRRQTALRIRGRSFETVELDDDGNVIEPIRCTCGSYILMHRPTCPFYCIVT